MTSVAEACSLKGPNEWVRRAVKGRSVRQLENAGKAVCGCASPHPGYWGGGCPPTCWDSLKAPQGREAAGRGDGRHGAWSASRAWVGSGFSPARCGPHCPVGAPPPLSLRPSRSFLGTPRPGTGKARRMIPLGPCVFLILFAFSQGT